jgi:hypothetical protein
MWALRPRAPSLAALPEAPSVCRVTPREGRRHVPCGGQVLTAGTTSMPTALPCLSETPSPLPAACALTRRAIVCADTAAAVCQCTDRTVRCVHEQRGLPQSAGPASQPPGVSSLVPRRARAVPRYAAAAPARSRLAQGRCRPATRAIVQCLFSSPMGKQRSTAPASHLTRVAPNGSAFRDPRPPSTVLFRFTDQIRLARAPLTPIAASWRTTAASLSIALSTATPRPPAHTVCHHRRGM